MHYKVYHLSSIRRPSHWYEYGLAISPRYKADPADSLTELLPLIWIYGLAISPRYKADPADSLTELLPLIWIYGLAISPRYKADPADNLTDLLPLIWIYGLAIIPWYKADPADSLTELLPLIWIWIGNQSAVQGWPRGQSQEVLTSSQRNSSIWLPVNLMERVDNSVTWMNSNAVLFFCFFNMASISWVADSPLWRMFSRFVFALVGPESSSSNTVASAADHSPWLKSRTTGQW